jgi:hypothetical protein
LLVDLRTRGVGKRSRAPVEVSFTVVVRLRNGRIYRVQNFQGKDRGRAFKAARLSD